MEKITAAEWCISDHRSARAVLKLLPDRKTIFIPNQEVWEKLRKVRGIKDNGQYLDYTCEDGRRIHFLCYCPECRKEILAKAEEHLSES